MTAEKRVKEGWIQLARELRREVYNPLDSVNNPSIRLLETYKSALRKAIEDREQHLFEMGKQDPEISDYCLVRIAELQFLKRTLDTVLPNSD